MNTEIETQIKNALEIHGNRPIRIKKHYAVKPLRDNRPIMTIEHYISAHKRLSLSDFTTKDISQISAMNEGFFIVNNCKIPVKNGALLLNQWTSRYAYRIKTIKQTIEQKKISNKISHQKHRDLVKSGNLEEAIDDHITFTSMTSIFHDFNQHGNNKNTIKRNITATHIEQSSLYIPDMFFEDCHRPIVKMTSLNNYSGNEGIDDNEKPISVKMFVTIQDKYNKHYEAQPLYLRADNGTLYQYTDSGLELVKIEA